MYKIVYEPEAENDLIEILSYYAENGGFRLAQAINERIQHHIKKLENMPFRSIQSENIPDAREFLIDNLPYKAYIFINEDTQTIHILNIVHTARKFPN